ncbi:ras-related and estrogen-regulated growth inhibitor isoform X2 [Exaiptasia diaphana]|nr:ras-related and estrogen-regulated growth inhibitor isoform X2 [Exaiptasia diaphana]KXJ27464.1 Ras-related and estrogen-regulated growth inhibitor [Exaiptasia diaphana]
MQSRKISQIQQPSIKTVRIVLLGQEGVGKSALVVRFLTRRFIGEYDSNLESSYRHISDIDGVVFCLDIIDTAGEVTERKLQQCRSQGDIFLILYSIADRKSFQEAANIGKYLQNDRPLQKPKGLALVGNKNDLEHFREVVKPEARDLATELSCSFYEISVSERTGFEEVSDVIHSCLRQYLKHAQYDRPERNASVSYLSKMKEGIKKRRNSIRRKSVAF